MLGTTRGPLDPRSTASRLRRRAAFAAFLLVLLAGSAILYPQYRNRSESLAAGLEANGKALILSLLRLHGGAGSPAKLAAAAAELAGNTVLAGGTIVTANGLPLASFGEPPDLLGTGPGDRATPRGRNEEGSRFEFYWSAETLSAPVGVIGRLDASEIVEFRRGILLRNAVIVLLAAGCAAAGVALVLGGVKRKSNPLTPVAPRGSGAQSAGAGGDAGDAISAVAKVPGLIIHPDATGEESIKRRLARHRNPGEPFVRRFRDGRWIRTTEYRTSDGGTVGLHADITNAMERERELAEKSSILETTLDNMLQGISTVDGDLRILSVNRKAAEILDIPAELCQPGRHIGDWFRHLAEKGEYGPGDVETLVRERIEAAKKFEPARYRRERPDGSIIEISRNPLPGGGYVTTFDDVTDGARADEALRASQERLAGILDISDDAIISVDDDHRIILFNRGAEDIFGYAADEVMGRRLEVLLPASVRGHHAQLVEGFAGSSEISRTMKDRGEITGMRKGGAEFPVEASISRLELSDQKIFTVMLRDITERKRAAWEREQLLEQVHQAQKMDAVGTLAAGIAHDFNNLLVSILGYADLGLDDLPDDHPVRGNFLQVQKAGQRATKLVQQMLTLSRKENSERHPVRLAGVVGEALELLRASIPSSVEIRDNISGNCLPTLAFESEIHQVVVNLCMNASQAIGSDMGSIEVRLEDIDIGLDLASKLEKRAASPANGSTRADTAAAMLIGELPAGACVRLTVRDTGRGMDRVTMNRIFEPFFTEQRVGEGSGLGLFTAHGIVAAHKGAIFVTSAPSEGATFEIYLPACETDERAAPPRDSKGINGTERVLFVDDERDLVALARTMLERLGYTVEGVTSSTAALARFRSAPEQWDLVITDQTMPQLTGEALAREILAIRENIPIILCTGFSDVIDEERARAMGIRGYLNKPAVGVELAAAVRQALDS